MKSLVYSIIRSDRKTLAIQITRELQVVIRAPRHLPAREIDRLVAARADWIDAHLASQREKREAYPEPTGEEILALRQKAADMLPARVAHYAAVMGLSPAGISITGAKTRHGSCSGKNRLSFSYRLMRYPDAAIDYVVVHELAHIRHKNHGEAFYRLVESILPDYAARRALLKTN